MVSKDPVSVLNPLAVDLPPSVLASVQHRALSWRGIWVFLGSNKNACDVPWVVPEWCQQHRTTRQLHGETFGKARPASSERGCSPSSCFLRSLDCRFRCSE